MNGYVAFYLGKRCEIQAETLLSAKEQAVEKLRVPKSKRSLLSVVLAEQNGKPVLHVPVD